MGNVIAAETLKKGAEVVTGGGGEEAAEASLKGAEIVAQSERDKLAFLREREALPREISERALTEYAGEFTGGTAFDRARQSPYYDPAVEEELVGRATTSPFYQQYQEQAEKSFLRNQQALGGLRGGAALRGLAEVSEDVLGRSYQRQRQNLFGAYEQQLEGMRGLSGLPSQTAGIAQGMGNIGQILGQGQIAAGQAIQTGKQQGIENLLGLGAIGAQAFGFSDRRLKKNIVKVGKINGLTTYTWNWNALATDDLGLVGPSFGVMADEVAIIFPDAVKRSHGYLTVDYDKIGVTPPEITPGVTHA